MAPDINTHTLQLRIRSMSTPTVVLGSRSPRRRDLLGQLVGHTNLRLCPPLDPEELGFAGIDNEADIEHRLLKVVTMKFNDVAAQLAEHAHAPALPPQNEVEPAIVVADTIVMVHDQAWLPLVLGQPHSEHWRLQVREWFQRYLSGTTHSVWTGFAVARSGQLLTRIVKTEVSFAPLTDRLIDWYIATAESPGKAGGYAIQGHASSFICGIQGSVTNVIGLPLLEVADALNAVGVNVPVIDSGESQFGCADGNQ